MAAWTSSTPPRRALRKTALSTVRMLHGLRPSASHNPALSEIAAQLKLWPPGRAARLSGVPRIGWPLAVDMTNGLSVVDTRAGLVLDAACLHASRMRRRNTRRASGRIVCDRCVVYGGQEDVEPYTTDSSPPYTTTLRAPSAAIIRTAGTFMPCVFLTPTTASLKLCVPFTFTSNSIQAKAQGTCSWQGAPPFFRHRHRRSAPKIGTPRL